MMNEDILDKLRELKVLMRTLGLPAKSTSFSINEDDSGISYGFTVMDGQGNSESFNKRISTEEFKKPEEISAAPAVKRKRSKA